MDQPVSISHVVFGATFFKAGDLNEKGTQVFAALERAFGEDFKDLPTKMFSTNGEELKGNPLLVVITKPSSEKGEASSVHVSNAGKLKEKVCFYPNGKKAALLKVRIFLVCGRGLIFLRLKERLN